MPGPPGLSRPGPGALAAAAGGEAGIVIGTHALLAKGVPPVRRPAGAEVHHALFVPRLPRRKPRLTVPNVHVLDAADVLAVLR